MVTNTCIHVLLTLLILCLLCLLNVPNIPFLGEKEGRRKDRYGPSSSFKNISGKSINVMIPIYIWGKMSLPK